VTDETPDDDPVPARLLRELGAALGQDRLPAGLVERAEQLVDFLDFDRTLVALLEESGTELVGVRGATDEAGRPQLSFESADRSVSLELVLDRDALRGQLLAGTVTEVVLERPDRTVQPAAVSELGRFDFGPVSAGPARLRLGSAAHAVTSDWFTL